MHVCRFGGSSTPAAAPSSSSSSSSSGSALEEETHWRRWVDERLVKVITANIYRNWE
jgi:microsomal prostaglandin-E synthase 2